MMGMTSVVVAGNITKDPELRKTGSGKSWVNLTIAVNRKWKTSDGEFRKDTDFFPVVAWNGTAENCVRFLKRGQSVLVEGRLQTRSYTGKDGVKRFVTEVCAGGIQFLSTGPRNNTISDSASEQKSQDKDENCVDENVDFSESDAMPF
ncbi:MAG: single-stranded DNA-binding protein [Candidatus Riflebacteria bacterium]|nr:single-stranded DNA-binding protein [Candidatus Riflebacteria bacterium]